MSDIRKRTGKKGTTYQVRYPSKTTKSGYAFATFDTLKEARNFVESGQAGKSNGATDHSIRTVCKAIEKWLSICVSEGRDGRDPVTAYTHKTYQYRASIMNAYDWDKELYELQAPDVVEFRSWLLRNYTRDQARKALSSFHSVMKEMTLRGYIASNVAAGISIRADSRYDEPVVIPTPDEVQRLLAAADRLANSKNKRIAQTWQRYRPILYLAVDSGMRPQEYLAVAQSNLMPGSIKVDRAIERGGHKISVTKTRAGRREIDLSSETLEMMKSYSRCHAVSNKYDLIFPTASGRWQSTDNWRKRGFYVACIEAGLIKKEKVNGKFIEKPKFKPYDLRHFYASMLIEQKVNLKRIQRLMGHEDIKTTLNVYGHLIEQVENVSNSEVGMVSILNGQNSCGKSVASTC